MASIFESESASMAQNISQQFSTASDFVRLNVGGQKFTTRRSTLCQIEGSLLSSMFGGRRRYAVQRDDEGCIFLDFNPNFFALILDYLRARLVATPEQPACLPEVNPKEIGNFNSLVNYLGLAEEFQPNQFKKFVFGRHTTGVTVNGATASFTSSDQWSVRITAPVGIVLSENTYSKGVVHWQLSFSNNSYCAIFVGVTRDDSSVLNPNIDNRARCLHSGSFGWTLDKDHCKAVINECKPQVQLGHEGGYEYVELILDCPRKTLTLVFLTGQKFHISLPNSSTDWKLQIGLNDRDSVRILNP